MSEGAVAEVIARPEAGATSTAESAKFLNTNGMEASGHGVGPLLNKVGAAALTGIFVVGAFNFFRNFLQRRRNAVNK